MPVHIKIQLNQPNYLSCDRQDVQVLDYVNDISIMLRILAYLNLWEIE